LTAPEDGPSAKDRAQARPYLLTARASSVLALGAVVGGFVAMARHGPLAGLVALLVGLWVARLARAPMPDDLRKRFD